MQEVQLLFDNSPWLVLVCVAVGLLYATLLYFKSFKNKAWSRKINYALSALRFVAVSLLCLLIVGPFVKQIKNNLEKPVVVFAIDNSSSIQAVEDSSSLEQLKERISHLGNTLQEKGYTTDYRSLEASESLDSIQFAYSSSDINALLKDIASDYEGSNLASVVLVSDGIYNRGISPTYNPYNFIINTVGLGDTVPKQDINISTLYYNKIAYQGNKFPLVAEIASTGFAGSTAKVTVSRQGRVLASQQVSFKSSKEVNALEFLLNADKEGTQHYVVTVEPQEAEFTQQNNTAHAYIEVIEGKEKILLVAQAPHPDIKAIKAAIESNKNYELQSVILSVAENPEALIRSDEKYDLVIFHQLPGKATNAALFDKLLDEARSKLFIVGSQTDLLALNQVNSILNIASISNDVDEVSAVYNQNFDGFQLENSKQAVISEFLPVTVPFSNVEVKNNADVLLYQKVGNVTTSKPLLAAGSSEDQKTAVLLAEGTWQWRLQEYARHENTEAFNTLFTKLVQYLSAKEDKRRFKVYPIKSEFEDTEPVVFETEIYNDVYEQVYGLEISLVVRNEGGEEKAFSYTTNSNNTQYRISNLPEGIYQYTATTSMNGEPLSSSGEFTVKRLQIETLNLTANHDLLRQLAEQSGGTFVKHSRLDTLAQEMENQEAKGRIYTSEAYLPIINLKWLFFVILTLITLEWGIRKFMGSY